MNVKLKESKKLGITSEKVLGVYIGKESSEFKSKYLGQQITSAVTELDLIPWTGNPITVTLDASEFTSHCPKTGQPDFATISITYRSDKFIVETKSVKLFMWQFRDKKEFNEKLVDYIAKTFNEQLQPKWIRVIGKFAIRGGISVTAESFLEKGI